MFILLYCKGLGFDPPPTIHVNTARNYLKAFGYKYSHIKKGMYVDGHERKDVVAYRMVFLQTILELEKLMPMFEGENMEIEIWPELLLGEKPHILVTHDECVFSSYDGMPMCWMPEGEQPLRKKGQGRSLHVSEFLTDVCGRLKLEVRLFLKI